MPIRVHSWFLVFSVPLRGSVFSRVFRVFRGFENFIRAHSCPFVVLRFFRAPSWFCFFRVFRGSIPLVPLAMTMMIIFPFA